MNNFTKKEYFHIKANNIPTAVTAMVTLNSIITFVATDVLPEDVENNMNTPNNIRGCHEEYNYRRADICNPKEKS